MLYHVYGKAYTLNCANRNWRRNIYIAIYSGYLFSLSYYGLILKIRREKIVHFSFSFFIYRIIFPGFWKSYSATSNGSNLATRVSKTFIAISNLMLIKYYTLAIRSVHSDIPLRINLFMFFYSFIHVSSFIHVFLIMFHGF